MTARTLYKYLLPLITPLLLACSDYLSYEPYDVVSIAHLKSLLHSESVAITQSYVIQGYVVANDQQGECYRSIILSDGSGGIELKIDASDLYRRFPLYSHHSVHCATLWMGDYGGRVLLGLRPTDSYPVSPISEDKIDLYIKAGDENAPEFYPSEITLGEIAAQHIGNSYILRGVTFAEQAGTEWCERDPITGEHIDTERIVYDSDGNSLPIRISRHCSYVSATIPRGEGSMVVIVQYFNGEYSLMIANYQLSF
ncbi:MAG: hypothetical protein IJB39_07975 [Alistipes sp.]|nr:hypothetical protein [Alistipes sp.]